MSVYIREFVGRVKLRISRWGDNPGSFFGLSIITRVVVRGRMEDQSR